MHLLRLVREMSSILGLGFSINWPMLTYEIAFLQSVEETIGILYQLSLAIRRASNRNSVMKASILYDTNGAQALIRKS